MKTVNKKSNLTCTLPLLQYSQITQGVSASVQIPSIEAMFPCLNSITFKIKNKYTSIRFVKIKGMKTLTRVVVP